MKQYLHILLLLLTATILVKGLGAQNPNDLPMACTGTYGEYWVNGLKGSTFEWRILNSNGQPVDVDITYVNDTTVLVYWSPDLIGGIYTFEVIEHTMFDCVGDPYNEDIVINASGYIEIPLQNVTDFFEVCFGQEKDLAPGNFLNYLWTNNNSGSPIFTTGEAGTYEVRLVDFNQNCAYHPIVLEVNPLPEVWLGNDTVLFGAQNLLLDVYDPSISVYNWSTGAISSSIIVEGGYGDQYISVTVTDFNGCSNSDEIFIAGADYRSLRIPSAFTPNGDGVNDTWIFPAPAEGNIDLYPFLNDIDVKVFNRWGKLVWQSEGMFREWDGRDLGGRPLPMDSYHYIIKINVDRKTFTYKGSVTIVR